MYKNISYFSFQEILDYIANAHPIEDVTLPAFPHDGNCSDNWFSSICADIGLQVNLTGLDPSSTIITPTKCISYMNEVLFNVYNRHADEYLVKKVTCTEVPDYSEEVVTDPIVVKALSKLINIFELTGPKYIPIIFQFEKNYAEPLKKLESESESFSRFNDTPQNEIDEVDFNSGSYASNMGKSKNVSKVDSGSVSAKLKEMREAWRSIILDWSNEFDQAFIDPYQIGGE